MMPSSGSTAHCGRSPDIFRALERALPAPVSDADLVLMRRIDELHLNFPFTGTRMLRMLKLARTLLRRGQWC